MPTRVILGDTATGRRIVDVPISKLSWSQVLNDSGSMSCTIPLFDRRARKLGLRAAATTLKSFMAVVESDTFMNAGPVWKHTYDEDAGTLQLDASGIWSYFDHRTVNDPSVVTNGVLAADGSAAPAATYTYTNISFTTMAKRIIQMVRTWPNSAIPMTFPNDEVLTDGTTKTYLGADLKSAGDAIYDLTQLEGGPDIMFDGQWTNDRQGVLWNMVGGTTAVPTISAKQKQRWDASVPRRSIRKIVVAIDGTDTAGYAWTSGGRTGDVALIDLQVNPGLTAAGYPATEFVDSTHSSVVLQSTLASYGRENLRKNNGPTEYWTFEVRADRSPFVGEYSVGDYCQVVIGDNDPYLSAGVYERRILTISGDEQGKWLSITTGEVTSVG